MTDSGGQDARAGAGRRGGLRIISWGSLVPPKDDVHADGDKNGAALAKQTHK